jgi:peptidylprolyl isomerase
MTKYIFLIIVLALIVSYFVRSNANREAAKINAIEAEQFLAKNRQVEGVM